VKPCGVNESWERFYDHFDVFPKIVLAYIPCPEPVFVYLLSVDSSQSLIIFVGLRGDLKLPQTHVKFARL
jgi:hypothetical protein